MSFPIYSLEPFHIKVTESKTSEVCLDAIRSGGRPKDFRSLEIQQP